MMVQSNIQALAIAEHIAHGIVVYQEVMVEHTAPVQSGSRGSLSGIFLEVVHACRNVGVQARGERQGYPGPKRKNFKTGFLTDWYGAYNAKSIYLKLRPPLQDILSLF